MEEIENKEIQNIEKPKKEKLPISEKQRKHLQDMRDKRTAMKILKKDKKYQIKEIDNNELNNNSQGEKTNIDLIKLSDEISEIKKHLQDIKNLKEEKKKLKDAVDIKTTEEKKESYDDMYYKKQLFLNFVK
jgi:hypothetical protein